MVQCPDCLEEFTSSYGVTMHQSLGKCWAQQFLKEAELYHAQHPSSLVPTEVATKLSSTSASSHSTSMQANDHYKNKAADDYNNQHVISNNSNTKTNILPMYGTIHCPNKFITGWKAKKRYIWQLLPPAKKNCIIRNFPKNYCHGCFTILQQKSEINSQSHRNICENKH